MKPMTKSNARSHFFVSYSRSDRIAVDKLIADLRQRGYTLWVDIDERGIEPGEDWRNELAKQMSAAECVIACVSPDFLESSHCRAEIEQAQRENKRIFQAIVRRLNKDQSLKDFNIDHLQYADLTINYEDGLRKLLVALPPPQAPLRNITKKVGIIAGVLAVIALAFIGVMLAVRGGISSIQPTITPLPPTATVALQNFDVSVVVSYFVVDAPDAVTQADADALIERFSKALDQQLASEIGSSSLNLSYKLDGPTDVPRITGKDAQARQQAAIALLDARQAKVAIYGVIAYDEATRQMQLQPEFYIAADRYFNDAQDLTGSYQFGRAIPADSLDERGKLGARVTALSYIMTGLFEHMTRQYDSALDSYQAALDTPNWDEADGKDILYMLIGNSRMKLAEEAARQCDRGTVLEQTDSAETAYNESTTINNEYPRAFAGLANVYAVRALWLPEDNDGCASRKLNLGALQEAAGYLQLYEEFAGNTPEQDLGVWRKMLLTEVQVHFLLWAAQDRATRLDDTNPEYAAMNSAVEKIIQRYSSNSDSTWANPVMEAYIFRGQAHYARAQFRDALDDYRAALGVYDNVSEDASIQTQLLAPERAMTVYGLQGDAFFQLGSYQEASNAYYQALTMARDLAVEGSIASYEERLKRADTFGTATPTRIPPTAEATGESSPEITVTSTEPAQEASTVIPEATLEVTATTSS